MDAPIETKFKMIEPFTEKDLMSYFFQGAFLGGGILGLLAIGAWLISIMRKRITTRITTIQTRSLQNNELLTHDPTSVQPN